MSATLPSASTPAPFSSRPASTDAAPPVAPGLDSPASIRVSARLPGALPAFSSEPAGPLELLTGLARRDRAAAEITVRYGGDTKTLTLKLLRQGTLRVRQICAATGINYSTVKGWAEKASIPLGYAPEGIAGLAPKIRARVEGLREQIEAFKAKGDRYPPPLHRECLALRPFLKRRSHLATALGIDGSQLRYWESKERKQCIEKSPVGDDVRATAPATSGGSRLPPGDGRQEERMDATWSLDIAPGSPVAVAALGAENWGDDDVMNDWLRAGDAPRVPPPPDRKTVSPPPDCKTRPPATGDGDRGMKAADEPGLRAKLSDFMAGVDPAAASRMRDAMAAVQKVAIHLRGPDVSRVQSPGRGEVILDDSDEFMVETIRRHGLGAVEPCGSKDLLRVSWSESFLGWIDDCLGKPVIPPLGSRGPVAGSVVAGNLAELLRAIDARLQV